MFSPRASEISEYHGLVPPLPSFLPNGERRGGAGRSLGGPLHLRGLPPSTSLPFSKYMYQDKGRVFCRNTGPAWDARLTDACHGHDSHHAGLTCGVDGV